jgi:hypothetical protein
MDAEHEGAEATTIPRGYRLHNGELVPAAQPAITRIITKHPPKPDPRKRWALGGGAVLVLAIVLVVVALARSGTPEVRRVPADEKKFLQGVQDGQYEVHHGNAFTLVTARGDRSAALCNVLEQAHQTVRGWLGTIHDIDTRGDDEGIITVSIGSDTDLRTGSGAGADKRMLVNPGSGVYRSVAGLHDGDRVVFAGTFVRSGTSCVKETSVHPKNGMLTPDFLFVFSSIAPA